MLRPSSRALVTVRSALRPSSRALVAVRSVLRPSLWALVAVRSVLRPSLWALTTQIIEHDPGSAQAVASRRVGAARGRRA